MPSPTCLTWYIFQNSLVHHSCVHEKEREIYIVHGHVIRQNGVKFKKIHVSSLIFFNLSCQVVHQPFTDNT